MRSPDTPSWPPLDAPQTAAGGSTAHPTRAVEPPTLGGRVEAYFTLPGGNDGNPIYDSLVMERTDNLATPAVGGHMSCLLAASLHVVVRRDRTFTVLVSRVDPASKRMIHKSLGEFLLTEDNTVQTECVLLEAATLADDRFHAPW